jgi:hypothetical protein
MATFNKKRMDLSKGSAFNYQGLSAMNWIMPMLVFFLPMIIYAIFNWIGNQYLALAALGLLGIIGLLARKFLVGLIERNFYRRKYLMAEGFREGN